MSIAGNQQRTLLDLLGRLRPHWRSDRALPARIQSLLAGSRAFGSRDRRLYRELIYTTLRYLPWVEPLLEISPDFAVRTIAWLSADSPATATLRAALLDGWPACPANVAEKGALLRGDTIPQMPAPARGSFDPGLLLPGWIPSECPEALDPWQLNALLTRAPLWLRLQTENAAAVTAEFDAQGWHWEPALALPSALRIRGDVDVTRTDAFREGLFEIQDLGSQLLLARAGIVAGGHWLDACAGAGGKTLQLSRLVGPEGRVDAYDPRSSALDELKRRAARMGARNIGLLRVPPSGTYDGVLVDAPCSGSGTWRRAPHLKWATPFSALAEAAQRQSQILAEAAQRVRAGGRLIYATCSLARTENDAVVRSFLAAHPDFSASAQPTPAVAHASGTGYTLLPGDHDGDGFFVAYLQRQP